MSKTECPVCGAYKKPWFDHCFECTENLSIAKNQSNRAFIEEKNYNGQNSGRIEQKNYASVKKNKHFQNAYEAKYYFNNYKVRSKSELLICFFLTANGINFEYEPPFNYKKELRPDFILRDNKGNKVIFEHFEWDSEEYRKKQNEKIKDYNEYCAQNKNYYFIYTEKEDMYNLKENVGKKLNTTPLKKAHWD